MRDLGVFDHLLFSTHRYALVAAEHGEQLPNGIPAKPIARHALTDSVDLMPRLVDLNRLSDAQRAELIDVLQRATAFGGGSVLSVLLTSEATVQQIESHVAAIQLCRGPTGDRAWLRVHDPRVWLHLPRIFGDDAMLSLFGPITRWSVCIGGRWISTRPTNGTLPRTASRADAEQWAALERVGVVNRVLARMGCLTADCLDKHSPAIDALVLRGQSRHALERVADLVAYATLGMTIHPRFDESAVALRAIDDHVRDINGSDSDGNDASVVDALIAVPQEQWSFACRQLNDQNNREHVP